ncbi:MAG: hypothetical protein U0166_04390 [Acidobacteriota bacterium]
MRSSIVLLLSCATAAYGWDGHSHKTMTEAALPLLPRELRDKVAAMKKPLLEGAVAPDSATTRGSFHGAALDKKLAQSLAEARDRFPKMGPTEMATRLGTIGHMAADFFSTRDLQAPINSDAVRWLDNNKVLFAYDGPTSATSAEELVKEWAAIRDVLAPGNDAVTLRFDLGMNAMIDAWQFVSGGTAESWKQPQLIATVGRGTDWALGSMGDGAGARSSRTSEPREESDGGTARSRTLGRSGTVDLDPSGYVAYEGGGLGELGATSSSARDRLLQNIGGAYDGEASEPGDRGGGSDSSAIAKAMSGRGGAAAPVEGIVVIDKSVSSTIVVRVRNMTRSTVTSTVANFGGVKLTLAAPMAPGEVHRFVFAAGASDAKAP